MASRGLDARLLGVLLALSAPLPAVAGRTISVARGGLGMPAYVDPTVDALEGRAAQAVLQGIQQKGRATLSRAESAAASAGASSNRIQSMSVQNELRAEKLKDILAQATTAGNMAVQLETEARHAEEDLKDVAKSATEEAKKLAVQAVKDMFTSKYRKLESWRRKVLSDPNKTASLEARRAAAPFDAELAAAYARRGEHNAEAQALESQSEDLLSEAKALWASAQDKAQSNPAGAKQDFADARHLENRGNEIASEAKAEQASAADLQQQIAGALRARKAAALRAMRQANPQSLPPLAADPETAYAPPPLEG